MLSDPNIRSIALGCGALVVAALLGGIVGEFWWGLDQHLQAEPTQEASVTTVELPPVAVKANQIGESEEPKEAQAMKMVAVELPAPAPERQLAVAPPAAGTNDAAAEIGAALEPRAEEESTLGTIPGLPGIQKGRHNSDNGDAPETAPLALPSDAPKPSAPENPGQENQNATPPADPNLIPVVAAADAATDADATPAPKAPAKRAARRADGRKAPVRSVVFLPIDNRSRQ
ncbi:MAG: hypothetical protein LBR05_07575 [Azoarcus sp.]|nr:hypothetical protein [Azoarcus sp.]